MVPTNEPDRMERLKPTGAVIDNQPIPVKAWDYLHGRELAEVVAQPEPGDPHFDFETDTEEVPF